jgi:hypothetical protein
MIIAELPEQMKNLYPKGTIMVVIRPLYGIAEAGAYWWSTYFKYHTKKLGIKTITYDPCLLITIANSGLFGLMAVKTDDTLGFNNFAFAEKEARECVFLSKERQDLAVLKFFDFNGDILTLEDLILRLKQKNQGLKLEFAADRPFYIQQRARGAYIASICQPMANYDLSAAAQVIDPGSEDFARFNKRIKWQKKNLDLNLSFIPINLITIKVFVMVDALFANNPDLNS